MVFIDESADSEKKYNYQIISVNTVGLKSN
jgi:hypothetical protein